MEEEDSRGWRAEDGREFTVKSKYRLLEGLVVWKRIWTVAEQVFSFLWKSPMLAFSWKLLLDSVPTRRNLAWRKVIDPESSAVCEDKEETLCQVSCIVRLLQKFGCVFRWPGLNLLSPSNLKMYLVWLYGEGRNKKL